jgi:hypothetical protein
VRMGRPPAPFPFEEPKMASDIAHEIVRYSGVASIKLGKKAAPIDWGSLAEKFWGWLKTLCPAAMSTEAKFQKAYDKEYRRLMNGKEHCPPRLRAKFKREGIATKEAQNEAYFRLVTAANGYTLADLDVTDGLAEV